MTAPPRELPVIPLRDTLVFPGTEASLVFGRPRTLAVLDFLREGGSSEVCLCLQLRPEEEDVGPKGLHSTGVAAVLSSSTQIGPGVVKVTVEPSQLVRALEWRPHPRALFAKVQEAVILPSRTTKRRLGPVVDHFRKYLERNPDIPPESLAYLRGKRDPEEIFFLVAGLLRCPAASKQALLEEGRWQRRVEMLEGLIHRLLHGQATAQRIEHQVRSEISRSQNEYYLTEQLKRIQIELGPGAPHMHPEIRKLESEVESKRVPSPAREKVLGEIRRLEHLHPSSPEHSVVRHYVDWILSLPWGVETRDNRSLASVKRKLDLDHFGLKDVKDRILEHVAVYNLAGRHKSPVLCFAGPPGVGKTSLGMSIAHALGRKFVRMSLGGIRDEAEIRGHRRTYIGSMPGRIVQMLRRSGSWNPVILLDELDKMGTDYRGDPAAALLEVLDPEQNGDYSDHFLEVGIDLSRIFFITTANLESEIPPALRDRLEVIHLSGYSRQEKVHIGSKYLVPKVCDMTGLKASQLRLSQAVLERIVSRHTREAGVRGLEKAIASIARKRARRLVGGRGGWRAVRLSDLETYLGAPVRLERGVPGRYPPGVVTGLAWTASGGEVLQVECSMLSGRGRLKLTGKLGEVMRESGELALTLARERARRYGVDPSVLRQTDIHIHVPEGAIPKDGPSAGIPLLLCILSALTRRPLSPHSAFTGEITLRGRIHAVGGVPDKILAAAEAGVRQVYLPRDNAADLSGLPPEIRRGLRIHLVDDLDAILHRVLPPSPKRRPRRGNAVRPRGRP